MIGENKTKNNDRGLIKMLLLLVIILVILSFLGFNIENIWSNYILKILTFIWGVIVILVNFITGALLKAIEAVGDIFNL